MTNHPNRNWRSRWRVDLSACTSTHLPTGIVIQFVKDDLGWDGKVKQIDQLNEMIADSVISIDAISRIMKEAGDIYKEHLDKRQ